MKNIKTKIRYCSLCKSKMRSWLKPANECFNLDHWGDKKDTPVGPKYDVTSGKENFCEIFRCPRYKKPGFFTISDQHDNYFEKKIQN